MLKQPVSMRCLFGWVVLHLHKLMGAIPSTILPSKMEWGNWGKGWPVAMVETEKFVIRQSSKAMSAKEAAVKTRSPETVSIRDGTSLFERRSVTAVDCGARPEHGLTL